MQPATSLRRHATQSTLSFRAKRGISLTLFVRVKDRERQTASSGLFQGAFDEGETAFGLFAEKFFAVAAVFLGAVKFIGNRKRGEDGNFLRVDRGCGRRDGVHFFVDVLSKLVDIRFVQLAADRVRLAEYFDFYGTAHVSGL